MPSFAAPSGQQGPDIQHTILMEQLAPLSRTMQSSSTGESLLLYVQRLSLHSSLPAGLTSWPCGRPGAGRATGA